MSIIRNLQKIIFKSRYSQENKIITHLTDDEKFELFCLAKRYGGMVCVEIGSYLGASSCFIAAGIKKTKRKAKFYCVDTWENDAMTEGKRETFQVFVENTQKYQDIIIPLRGISVEVAKTFKDIIDFLFIDGDHSYEGVKADVDAWFPKLSENVIVIFHDYGWAEGVQRVVNEFVRPLAKKEIILPNMYVAFINKRKNH